MQRNKENSRMGKPGDLFKKTGDTKGPFHAKMGMIKNGSGKDLTEVERWQEYPQQLIKKVSMTWIRAPLVAQLVKNLSAMWETWVPSLGWEVDQISTPVFWPGKFHGLYSPWGLKELDTAEQITTVV